MKHSAGTIFKNILILLFGIALIMLQESNLLHSKLLITGLTFLGTVTILVGAFRLFASLKKPE